MDLKKEKKKIQDLLKKNGKKEVAKSYEKYFKGVVKFYGIRSPEFKELFKKYYGNHLKEMSFDEQKEIAYKMFDSQYLDDKNFGISILNKNAKNLNIKHLKEFEKIIDSYVYDWASCDGLSGKVITRMIKLDSKIAYKLKPWSKAKNIWRKRVSCVSLVNVARFGEFNDLIIEIVSNCIKSNERFVQLGLGWVLRELSLADLDLVVGFIKENYSDFSREGLRYAIEKMNPNLKKDLMDFGKN